jgi:hypothetical protein
MNSIFFAYILINLMKPNQKLNKIIIKTQKGFFCLTLSKDYSFVCQMIEILKR